MYRDARQYGNFAPCTAGFTQNIGTNVATSGHWRVLQGYADTFLVPSVVPPQTDDTSK